ncbi:MAG: sulfatase-like hydrolase/transferase [Eubacterium sp.]|nr:sulfatase-like hydrolase/transferase [Eubacterium sp.]
MFLFLFVCILLCFTYAWVLRNWAELTVDEIIFQLSAPLTGTGSGIMGGYIRTCLLPAIFVIVVLVAGYIFLLKKLQKWYRIYLAVISAAVLAVFVFCLVSAVNKFNVITYLKYSSRESEWIETNYVDPASTEITFPETKRNLIYIYLESMEVTFSDEASGGAFEDNYIPTLTALAEANEDFSGSSEVLNGGISMPGGTWTIAAMISETSGLPLKVNSNNLDKMDSIYPEVTTLGDILSEQGYNNVLMIGSDATFGGRKLYFGEHGDYEMCDYQWAIDQGYISDDYYQWWGYEDDKLFDYAQEKLTSLASSDEPFNLTLLTVDTHFPNGYVCDRCKDTYDSQYANVIACSDEQVTEFVEWVQQQDFYEDTTIIISGDHPTMDADFCEDIDSDYQRSVYTCYINADAETEDSTATRTFTTLDDFPTTLAALGCDIEGDRLGLGTNLFSSTPTLAEEYGVDEMSTELEMKSTFVNKLSGFTPSTEKINSTVTTSMTLTEKNNLYVKVYDAIDGMYDINSGYLKVTNEETDYSEEFALQVRHDYFKRSISCEDLSGIVYVDVYLNAEGEDYFLRRLTYNLDWSGYKATQADYTKFLGTLGEGYAVFMTTRLSAGNDVSVDVLNNLSALGIETKLRRDFRNSFLAVLINGEVVDQGFRRETLESSGTLPNGMEYYVLSSGKYASENNSILIDGTEYAQGHKGISYVIVDLEKNQVVDSAWFLDKKEKEK